MVGKIIAYVGVDAAMIPRGYCVRIVVATRQVLVCVIACVTMIAGVVAAENPPVVDQLHRVKQLTQKLRCLVCQNQSLAESDAELAVDLRRQVERKIQNGESDEQILRYMVDRYGDFVLYDPPLKWSTIVLWVGPFLIALISLAIFFRLAVWGATKVPERPGDSDRQIVEKLRASENEDDDGNLRRSRGRF